MVSCRIQESKKKSSVCSLHVFFNFFLFLLVSDVEERPWWPIQNPNEGRKPVC